MCGINFNFIIMSKAIKQANVRDLLDSHYAGDISYSKVTEELNEIAENFAIGFYNWGCLNDHEYPELEIKELLEIYKKTL